MSEEPEVRPEDALQVAQRALAKANRVDQLEREIADLREKITAVTLRLSEVSEDRPYRAFTLNEKIGMVREHAFRRAVDGHGKASLDYNDIMWGVFDGEPGAKHCYKLMRMAADADGFNVREVSGESKKLIVDADQAKQGVAFFPENKDSSGEVA